MTWFKIGVSRRGFVKLGFSGLAGMLTRKNADAKNTVNPGGHRSRRSVSRTSLRPLVSIPTTCRQCPAGCGIIAYLDGDRLVQVLGNPDHPDNRGGICAKGIAAINLANDVERILFPLKRTGSRGASKWSRITWDEAYTILQSRLKPVMGNTGRKSVAADIGVDDILLEQFLVSFGSASVLNRQREKNRPQAAACKAMTGSARLMLDVNRCRTVFNFGANPYENHDRFLPLAQRLVSARVDHGARLVTFDVRMSKTAAKSDLWIPVRAGTDGLLALSMARLILDKGWQHPDFASRVTPAAMGALKQSLAAFTTEFAASECCVPGEQIENLAFQFARRTPSVAIAGGGVLDHRNGFENSRSITLLNMIVGCFGPEGVLFDPGSFRNPLSPAGRGREPSGMPPGVFDLRSLLASMNRPEAVLVIQSNPAFDDPDPAALCRILSDESQIPFMVVVDTHLSETAMLADLVLPAATFLESWGLDIRMSFGGRPLVNLIQPAVTLLSDAEVLRSPDFDVGKLLERQFKPRGEAREIGQICLDLARLLGGNMAETFPFGNTRDYLIEAIATMPEVADKGGLPLLKKKGFWEGRPEPERRGRKDFSSVQFPLNTGFKSDTFPVYRSLYTGRTAGENMFVLTTFKNALDGYGSTNSKWAREFFHDNRLWMNRDSARKLGLESGTMVRVISPTGELRVRLLVTERIHPGSVAIAEGLGHTAFGNVARARKFASKDPDTRLIWWGGEGHGVNPKSVTERKPGFDPFSFGLKDTVVRIEKA